MASWSLSRVRARGDDRQVSALMELMQSLDDKSRDTVNYYSLIERLGGKPDEMEYAEGFWSKLERQQANVLAWNDEGRWTPPFDVYKLIECSFPGIKVYFFCEDIEQQMFLTNDKEHRFFPERFFLSLLHDMQDGISNWSYYAYNSLGELTEEVFKYIAKLQTENAGGYEVCLRRLHADCATFDQLKALIDTRDDIILHALEYLDKWPE